MKTIVLFSAHCPTRTNESDMHRPNKKRQQKDLARGKKKAAAQLKKNAKNKVKTKKALADKIKDRKAEKEEFKLKDEIRRIQNRGLTVRVR